MQKSNEDSEVIRKDFLKRELFSLRKGVGLTRWKLDNAEVLRTVAARRTNVDPSHLSSEQLYSYLLYELQKLGGSLEAQATRNAFALGLEQNPGSLIKRRADFASRIGRHPDTVEAYESRGIQEIMSRMQHPRLYRQTSNPITTESRPDLTDDGNVPRMNGAVRKMTAQGISELYNIDAADPHAPDVLNVLGQDTAPYLDANIEWLLVPSENGEDRYKIKMRYTFRRLKDHYRVGIVTSPHDAEALIGSGVVDEVAQLDRGAHFERETQAIIDDTHFVAHDTENNMHQLLRFKEMDKIAQRELLRGVWQVDTEDCRIIEVQIPPEYQKPMTRYEYRLTIDLKNTEYYAYWYAPGLMYLNTITVDVSRFPNREEWSFNLLPFFGPVFPGTLERTGDRYTMPAGSWIVQGHGFALTWQKKTASLS